MNQENQIYCVYAGKISFKSTADIFGRRSKPEAVTEEQLQELLKDYDANAVPLSKSRVARSNGNANNPNFTMAEEEY